MIQRCAFLPKFNPGDHVRMIDNSPAIVVGRVAPKSHYYIVDSQLYGRCTVFAGVRVYCSSCGCETPTYRDAKSPNEKPYGNAVKSVVEKWNTRTEMEL